MVITDVRPTAAEEPSAGVQCMRGSFDSCTFTLIASTRCCSNPDSTANQHAVRFTKFGVHFIVKLSVVCLLASFAEISKWPYAAVVRTAQLLLATLSKLSIQSAYRAAVVVTIYSHYSVSCVARLTVFSLTTLLAGSLSNIRSPTNSIHLNPIILPT